MTQFFKDLLSGSSEVSSKRVVALLTMFILLFAAIIALFKDDHCVMPEFMFNTLAVVAGSGLGLTAIENILKKREEPKVEEPKPEIPQ